MRLAADAHLDLHVIPAVLHAANIPNACRRTQTPSMRHVSRAPLTCASVGAHELSDEEQASPSE